MPSLARELINPKTASLFDWEWPLLESLAHGHCVQHNSYDSAAFDLMRGTYALRMELPYEVRNFAPDTSLIVHLLCSCDP